MTFENYLTYNREKAVFRNLVFKAKSKFKEEFILSISPQTPIQEIWKKVFWITGRATKKKGIKNVVEEKVHFAKEF